MAMVWRSISAMVSADSERGGSEQALSPECTPASSICSMMPAMKTSPSLSQMASTSTSVARLRKPSISTGLSPEMRNSSPDSSCLRASSSSDTTTMPRPPST